MDYNFLELVGRHTLFLGEVNTGKTRLTLSLIQEAVDSGLFQLPNEGRKVGTMENENKYKDECGIVVIDLGPDVTLPSGKKLGGKLDLSDSVISRIQYCAPEKLYAPRAMGRTQEEVISLAERNLSSIDEVLDSILNGTGEKPHDFQTIFVNDITMYFHRGKADRLIDLSTSSETFIANGYKGRSLLDDKGSGISRNEAMELEKFSSAMDSVITLG